MRRVVPPSLVPVAAVALLLAGCSSPTVALTPAPDATDVGCASVVVAMPQTIAAAGERFTDAQGTAAWGSPVSVTLTCGVETPEVSALPCYPVQGVNWLFDETSVVGSRVLTTYGRDPGVQVVVAGTAVSINDVLGALSEPIADATQATDRTCVAPSDAIPAPSTSTRATPGATP